MLAAGLLAACDPFREPESMFDEYLVRLGRVLDTPVVSRPVELPPQLPTRRERVREVPAIQGSLLDFFRLYGCELQHLVGHRNSSLGRTMHPLNALDYEVRFIVAAEECMDDIESAALAARVENVVELKRASLGAVVWNAVWGSREIENLLTRSRGLLPIDHDGNATSVSGHDLQLLEHVLAQALAGDPAADIGALDAVYQRWLQHSMAGQALRSTALTTARLHDAADILESRLEDRPLCHKGMRNRQADIMHSMFMSVYVGHVQPYLADIQRVRQELFPPLFRLATLADEPAPEPFEHYVATALAEHEEGGLWHEFDQAVERHTVAWQDLLGQCGMRPGA